MAPHSSRCLLCHLPNPSLEAKKPKRRKPIVQPIIAVLPTYGEAFSDDNQKQPPREKHRTQDRHRKIHSLSIRHYDSLLHGEIKMFPRVKTRACFGLTGMLLLRMWLFCVVHVERKGKEGKGGRLVSGE